MSAVAKLAVRAELGDFREQHVEALPQILHVQASDARRVDHPTTAGHGVQRPRRGGVAALGVPLAHASGQLRLPPFPADQRIHQRRLAHAGRSDNGHRCPFAAPGLQDCRGLGRTGIERHHGEPALKFGGLRRVVMGIVGHVGLGQHDDWIGSGIVGEGEVAFEPGQVEVGIARYGDEQRIDIGSNQLGWPLALTRPLQQRPPVQAAMQEPGVGIHKHPVSHRKFCGVGARRQVDPDLAGARKAGQSAAMHRIDPQTPKLGLGIFKLIFEEAVPTQLPHVGRVFARHHQAWTPCRNIRTPRSMCQVSSAV